jgi:hypothetical protein
MTPNGRYIEVGEERRAPIAVEVFKSGRVTTIGRVACCAAMNPAALMALNYR